MSSALRTALTWLGRLLLLAVPFVVVSSLFFPKGLQPLEPVLCPPGLELVTDGQVLEDVRENAAIYASVCASDVRLVEVTNRVFAVAGIAFIAAVATYALRSKLTPDELSAPAVPSYH